MQRSEGDRHRHIAQADWPVNVWEWCEDVYDPKFYSKTEANESDPVSTSSSANRVLRGGAWHSAAWRCRSAFRRVMNHTDRHIGFRPVWPLRE